MSNFGELLRNIGLSDKEAIIYLSNLKLGSNPASIIAKYADINRCTTYSILESLIKKGLITGFEKDKIKYFAALPPQQLINYVDEKRRDLGYYKNELASNLQQFEALQQRNNAVSSLVQSYTGRAGLSKAYNSVIKEESLCVWGVHSHKGNEFFLKFAPYFLNKKRTIRLIKYSNSKTYRFEIKNEDDLNKIDYIQPVEFITGKKIILASVSEPCGVEITNPELVKYFRNKFDLYWKNKKAPGIQA